jgi:hypothetical protein
MENDSPKLEILSSEVRLILECGRLASNRKTDDAVALVLLPEMRWDKFIRQARNHGLAPIAYRCLEFQRGCPRDAQQQLRREAILEVARSLEQIRALKELTVAFARSDIPWLCVKGPAMAMLYGDPALRPFIDLDVVIRFHDFQRALECLIELGYRPQFEMPFAWQEFFFRIRSEVLLVRTGHLTAVDLHWELVPARYSFAPVMDEIWAKAECINTFDIQVQVPNATDTLIFLCLHGAKHEWERLIWLVDIAVLITRGVNWGVVACNLEISSRTIQLQTSLQLVQILFKVNLPQVIKARLRKNSIVRALCDERINRWARGVEGSSPIRPWTSLSFRSMSRLDDRLRWMHDNMLRPTPLERQKFPLPLSGRAAYYAIRPFRLLWKYGRGRSAQPVTVDSPVTK